MENICQSEGLKYWQEQNRQKKKKTSKDFLRQSSTNNPIIG